jgi:hypothetical protein
VKTGQAGGKPISMLEGELGTLRRRKISGRSLGNIFGNRHQGGVVRALRVWQAGVKEGDACGPNPGRSCEALTMSNNVGPFVDRIVFVRGTSGACSDLPALSGDNAPPTTTQFRGLLEEEPKSADKITNKSVKIPGN